MAHQAPSGRQPERAQSSQPAPNQDLANQTEANLFAQGSNEFSSESQRLSSSVASRSSQRRAATFSPHMRFSGSRSRRAASPPDMAVEVSSSRSGYTRTGRISKAKKGLPVHHCHCGKSYTRAEHLRRHQKNHSDQSLICDWPDCHKIFHRDDLLQRHRERHNETQKGSPSREESVVSQSSAADSEPLLITPTTLSSYQPLQIPAVNTTLYPGPAPVSEPEPSIDPSPGSGKVRQFSGAPSFSHSQIPIAISYDGLPGLHPTNILPSQWIASPQHSASSCYTSPEHDYTTACITQPYVPAALRTRASSAASLIEPWHTIPNSDCKSPISATSTTLPFEWPEPTKSPTFQEMGLPLGIDPTLSAAAPPFSAHMESFSNLGMNFPRIKTYEERDSDERKMLFAADLFGAPSDPLKLSQYMENYWKHFHPSFPMIHKGSLLNKPLAPLLQAAMLAVGAQYSHVNDSKSEMRSLHELCLKILAMREHDVTLPSRLCDMQAIILVEILSQYRGRRLNSRFSPQFLEIYHFLSQDDKTISTRALDDLVTLVTSTADDQSRNDQWKEWIRISSRQRLLVSCFILEVQQSVLLQRESNATVVSGFDLPMPSPAALWDADSASQWSRQLQLHQDVSRLSYVYEVSSRLGMNSFVPNLDTFQSFLLISTYCVGTGQSDIEIPMLSGMVNPSPQAQLYALTAQLVRCTPIRELLATTGETWIFSEKVTSIDEFNSHKRTLRGWIGELWSPAPTVQSKYTDGFGAASATSRIRSAITLALRICQLSLDNFADKSTCPTPGTELGSYFAVLVLWAVTTTSTTRLRHAQIVANARSRPGSRRNTPSSSRVSTPQPASTANHPATRGVSASVKLTTLQHDGVEFIRALATPASLVAELSSLIDCTSGPSSSMKRLSVGDGGVETPPVLSRWQHGVSALLRLARARLSCGETRMTGELLDGVTGVLGTLAMRGWTEDWF